MKIRYNPDIDLEVKRCFDCGRYYAIEEQRGTTCPVCAHETLRKNYVEMSRLERSNRALRGALKRKVSR